MTRLFCLLFILTICIATNSRAQWHPMGVPACEAGQAQQVAVACSDGAGGVIIAWLDRRNTYPPHSSGQTMGDMWAQRLNSAGVPQWDANGVLICSGTIAMQVEPLISQSYPRIVSDGAGGAIITWLDFRLDYDIYVQRVDGDGVVQWPANGVWLTAFQTQNDPVITTDGAGGAIVAWRNQHDGVSAQRVNPAGIPQWTSGGVTVNLAPSSPSSLRAFDIASDGAGGAIVASDGNDQPIPPYQYSDIWAQRLTSSGTSAWGVWGVKVCAAFYYQWDPIIAESDGGAVIAWQDDRNYPQTYDIYAQRVDAAGVVQWGAGGVAVCTAASYQLYPGIVSDGDGGAILTWDDARTGDFYARDIYAQRVSSAGATQWTANGIPVCDLGEDQSVPKITSDGTGGAIIAWTDQRGSTGSIFAQRIDASGTTLWPDDGLGIETNPASQNFDISATPAVVSDLASGAIVAYANGTGSSTDVYAQRVSASGAIPTAVRPTTPRLFAMSDNYPDPFTSSTSFELTLARDSHVTIDVFDAAGRRVTTGDLGWLKAGPTRLSFDGLDDRSRALPSGVYFYRVSTGAETVTKKMVITR